MRYELAESESAGKWVCTDQENLIVCIFEQGKLNDTQQLTLLENFYSANFMKLAGIMSDMGDWLVINHKDKI